VLEENSWDVGCVGVQICLMDYSTEAKSYENASRFVMYRNFDLFCFFGNIICQINFFNETFSKKLTSPIFKRHVEPVLLDYSVVITLMSYWRLNVDPGPNMNEALEQISEESTNTGKNV
jgi:hypothetical protein